MANKVPERKIRDKKDSTFRGYAEFADSLATFNLPDNLPDSEDFTPIRRKKLEHPTVKWEDILKDFQVHFDEIETNIGKTENVPNPFVRTETDYIKVEVFPYLLPALTEAIEKARIWETFVDPRNFFNGIDHVSQVLWNNNPRYPPRKTDNLHIFNMPWVRAYLLERPRPIYPLSWLWTEKYAATYIQKSFRQYLVQRDEYVHEMRLFWKKLKHERTRNDININPFLAKQFALDGLLSLPPKNEKDKEKSKEKEEKKKTKTIKGKQ